MKQQPEQTLVIDVNLTRGLVALLSAILLVVALLAFLGWGQRQAAASGPHAPLATFTGQRQYYLAGAVSDATQALTACATGYHMASLWEILDPSGLEYNATLGLYLGDSKPGPLTGWSGWVRTGYSSYSIATPGKANCNAWSTTSDYGTTAALPADWGGSEDLHVWNVSTWSCGSAANVWCVED